MTRPCQSGKDALLTVSLFWDCGRFWSFGLLCCLAKRFSLRSFGVPYARRPGTSAPCHPFTVPLCGAEPHYPFTINKFYRLATYTRQWTVKQKWSSNLRSS